MSPLESLVREDSVQVSRGWLFVAPQTRTNGVAIRGIVGSPAQPTGSVPCGESDGVVEEEDGCPVSGSVKRTSPTLVLQLADDPKRASMVSRQLTVLVDETSAVSGEETAVAHGVEITERIHPVPHTHLSLPALLPTRRLRTERSGSWWATRLPQICSCIFEPQCHRLRHACGQSSVSDADLTCKLRLAYCQLVTDIFQAITAPARRAILDELVARDGQTLFELCARLTAFHEMSLSRQAISQHIDVLEEAGLLRSKRQGRYKFHYVDTAPLQALFARWPNRS